jgi:hypothetical protein
MGWYGLGWRGSGKGIVESSCEDCNEPSCFLSICATGGFSRMLCSIELARWLVKWAKKETNALMPGGSRSDLHSTSITSGLCKPGPRIGAPLTEKAMNRCLFHWLCCEPASPSFVLLVVVAVLRCEMYRLTHRTLDTIINARDTRCSARSEFFLKPWNICLNPLQSLLFRIVAIGTIWS